MRPVFRLLCAALCLLLMALPVSAGAFAAGDEGGWMSAAVDYCDAWISLRSEPSTKAAKLAEIPLGAQIEVQPADEGFFLCRYQGMTGYVLAQYIRLSPAGEIAEAVPSKGIGMPDAGDGWVNARVAFCDAWISLRSEPSTKAPRLAEIPLGAQIEVQPGGGQFFPCRYQGMTGYVLAQYVQMEQAVDTPDAGEAWVLPHVNEFLTLRNASGGTIATIPPGERLRVLGWREKEARVERVLTGQTGYVNTGYIMAENLDTDRWPYDYEALLADLEALPKGDRITAEALTDTVDGRKLYVVRVVDEKAPHHILIQCAMHAREIMTSALGGSLMRDMIDQFPEGIDGVCVHILPLVNPDGQAIALYGPNALHDPALAGDVRRWIGSDSARDWKANARGVDLNRNFDAGWQALTGRTPGGMRYRGPQPVSEPESRALVDYTARYAFDCTVSIHSHGSLIYWMGAMPQIEARTRSLAQAVSAITGYPMVTSESSVEKGGFKDWALEAAGIPSVTVEIGALDSVGSLQEYSAIALRFGTLIQGLAAWAVNG